MPEIRNKQKERQHAENYLMCRFFSAQEHKCDGNDGNSVQRNARPAARIEYKSGTNTSDVVLEADISA